jgi:uncharacterized protein
MAETLFSPGVLARENDQSFITGQPQQRGAAIIGPTVKGPVEVPTIVTSYSDYLSIFGGELESGSSIYSYLTSISANNYFQNGGTSLLVTRVTSGSFSDATSSKVSSLGGNPFSASANLTSFFTSVSGSAGSYSNLGVTSSAGGTGAEIDVTLDTDESVSSITIVSAGSGYSPGDVITVFSGSVGATTGGGTSDLTITLPSDTHNAIFNITSSFVLETISEGEIMNNDVAGEISNGALRSGSRDNVRWEVTSANSSSGTFSLIVRRGNDRATERTVLESYNNLSLDPYSSNFISKVIGDTKYSLVQDGTDYYIQATGSYPNASRYVRVKQVNKLTPRYFDNAGNAKDQFTGSLPNVQSGSFDGAVGLNIPTGRAANFYNAINSTDAQGLVGSDYNDAISLLSNQDEYKYNLITVPGLTKTQHSTQITSVVNNALSRGDNMAIIDLVDYNTQINTVVTNAAGFDNSYAATYWPWLQVIDPNTNELVWVPASTMVPGVYAFTDASSDPWFAPAGITRGGLGQVVRAERKLTTSNRDTLYEANVNPIATFPQQGVVVFGQKTLQKRASALDRVNVRRLLISLKSYITQIADNLVFEQNSLATRNNFLTQVNPYLESVQQRQGLYAFRVVMDETNNTPDVVDRNELVGQIFLQPTRTAEFIILDFNVLPTGATFPG